MYPSTFVYDYHLSDDRFLLIDTFGLSMNVVPRKIRDLVCSARGPIDVGGTDPEFVDVLVRRGYLWTGPEDEDARLQILERKLGGSGFVLAPTHACNASCSYCFQRNGGMRPLDMTPKILNSAFHYMKERLASPESPEQPDLTLYGGEPLQIRLHGLLERIFAFARSEGMTVNMYTNAIEFDGFTELFLRYRSNLGCLNITLDGPEDVHCARRGGSSAVRGANEFRRAVFAVEWFLDRDLPVSARINVDRHNLTHVGELAEWVRTAGWDRHPGFTLRCVPVFDMNPDNLDVITPEGMWVAVHGQLASDPGLASVVTCSPQRFLTPIMHSLDRFIAGHGGVAPVTEGHPRVYFCEAATVSGRMLGADGHIYCCFEAIGRPELAVGSFHPAAQFPTSRWARRSAAAITVCRRCRIMPLCGGGCPIRSVAGDVQSDHMVGLCEDRQLILRRYLDAMRPRLIAALNESPRP